MRPAFALAAVRDLPLYKLRDLQAYFAPRSEADPALLETMRANGVTCYVEGAGGWLLLCEAPGLRDMGRGGVVTADPESETHAGL